MTTQLSINEKYKEGELGGHLMFCPTKNKPRGIRLLLNFLSHIMIGKENQAATLFSILCQECKGKSNSCSIILFS
jgi:hypothetical protein